MTEIDMSSPPTDEQIEEYVDNASDDELLEMVWEAVQTSEESLQVVLDHVDIDSGPAGTELYEAASEVTETQGEGA